MAHRVERLRATGNGVDPLVAAHAFLSLGALLDADRACAGRTAMSAIDNDQAAFRMEAGLA